MASLVGVLLSVCETWIGFLALALPVSAMAIVDIGE